METGRTAYAQQWERGGPEAAVHRVSNLPYDTPRHDQRGGRAGIEANKGSRNGKMAGGEIGWRGRRCGVRTGRIYRRKVRIAGGVHTLAQGMMIVGVIVARRATMRMMVMVGGTGVTRFRIAAG